MICFGIDVSKGKSTVTAISSDGSIICPTNEVAHNRDELLALVSHINILLANDQLKVVCESTGYYHWPLVNFLPENKIWVSVLNPIITNKFAKTSLRNVKTDKSDSLKIARYGLMNWGSLKCSQSFGKIFDELHTYSLQYYQYLVLRVKARINLVSLLEYTMPGIATQLKEENGNHKMSDFANTYWHYDNIKKHREKTFVKDYKEWCLKNHSLFSESKAENFIALLKAVLQLFHVTLPLKL